MFFVFVFFRDCSAVSAAVFFFFNLTLLELQSRLGDEPVELQVVCPQNGTAVLKGFYNPFRGAFPLWAQIEVYVSNTSCFADAKVSVRWAKGKRLTNRLPTPSLMTLSPPGTDRILRVDPPPTRGWFQFLGIQKNFFRFLTWGNSLFFKNKRFHGGRETRTHDQRLMCCRRRHLFVKVSVRWVEGERLSDRLPNLSLITLTRFRTAVPFRGQTT